MDVEERHAAIVNKLRQAGHEVTQQRLAIVRLLRV
jgi:Fe2+ or Zn2+ uptake regulation protein